MTAQYAFRLTLFIYNAGIHYNFLNSKKLSRAMYLLPTHSCEATIGFLFLNSTCINKNDAPCLLKRIILNIKRKEHLYCFLVKVKLFFRSKTKKYNK